MLQALFGAKPPAPAEPSATTSEVHVEPREIEGGGADKIHEESRAPGAASSAPPEPMEPAYDDDMVDEKALARAPPRRRLSQGIGFVIILLAVAAAVYFWVRDLSPNDRNRSPVPGGTALNASDDETGGASASDGSGSDLDAASFDTESADVAINTVGYNPVSRKEATVTAIRCGQMWAAVRDGEGRTVLTGKTQAFPFEAAVPSNVPFLGQDRVRCLADFSGLTTPGTYRIVVPGVGASAPFKVAANALDDAFKQAMGAFYQWRCGQAVLPLRDEGLVGATAGGEPYEHGVCHLQDGYIDEEHTKIPGPERFKDGTGGWHDAGDYGKYTVNTGFSIGLLLAAWEDFGPGKLGCLRLEGVEPVVPGLPYYLDEVRYGLDWIMKMQMDDDDGRVFHKLTPENFEGLAQMPDTDTAKRFFCPWGTAATADFVAAAAYGARIFEPFDAMYAQDLIAKAQLSYEVLRAYPDMVDPDDSAFTTGPYKPDHDIGMRVWAAAELYESTGDETILTDLEELLTTGLESKGMGLIDARMDWWQQLNLGTVRYLSSQRSPDRRDPVLVARARVRLKDVVDEYARIAQSHAFHRATGDSTSWGINGEILRQTWLLHKAERVLGPNATLAEEADHILHHILGRNEYGRSMVTKVGHRPPAQPHHRMSLRYLNAWPGLIVGGPNPRWIDLWVDFYSNEVAINWNAGLVYALARKYSECVA